MFQSQKLVAVGDGTVGKTSLLCSYALAGLRSDNAARDCFTDHIPTVFGTFSVTVSVENQTPVQLTLYDTAAQEDYDRLRLLAYPSTDIFLVCYAVDSAASLKNVSEVWVPEIRHHSPGTPFLLVGLKTDLRNDTVIALRNPSRKRRKDRDGVVTREMGLRAARQLGRWASQSARHELGMGLNPSSTRPCCRLRGSALPGGVGARSIPIQEAL